jgi:hypothetical protein
MYLHSLRIHIMTVSATGSHDQHQPHVIARALKTQVQNGIQFHTAETNEYSGVSCIFRLELQQRGPLHAHIVLLQAAEPGMSAHFEPET